MNINNKLESKKEEFLNDLSIADLKGYIDSVITSYYNSYIKGNSIEVKEDIAELHNLIDFLEIDYPNINSYINYRLVCINNKVLQTILNRTENLLFYPSEVYIDYNIKEEMLNSLFDEQRMQEIIMETSMYNIHDFIELMDSLPAPKTKIPKELLKEIKLFIGDVKSGKYDNVLDVGGEYLTDFNPYDKIKKSKSEK